MIVVTGSSGLLGREVVRRALDRGWSVRGVDLLIADSRLDTNCEHVQVDLLDSEAVGRVLQGATCVIHTAALQHHSHPPRFAYKSFFEKNVEMTRNVVDAAVRNGVGHLVNISSDMVYGIPSGRPFNESDTPHPIGPYGWSKLHAEEACVAIRKPGVKVTIFRPRLIVGPGRLGILTRLFDRIRAGKSIPLVGDGANRYQMVSVADVADAVMRAVEQGRDGLFNLGSPRVPTVSDLLEQVARRAGSSSKVLRTPRMLVESTLSVMHWFRVAPLVPEQYRIAGVDYVLDTSAAQEQLGWSPQFDDIEMLWQAYNEYTNVPKAVCV